MYKLGYETEVTNDMLTFAHVLNYMSKTLNRRRSTGTLCWTTKNRDNDVLQLGISCHFYISQYNNNLHLCYCWLISTIGLSVTLIPCHMFLILLSSISIVRFTYFYYSMYEHCLLCLFLSFYFKVEVLAKLSFI